LKIAKNLKDDDLTGASMTGLGHSYRKMGNYDSSLHNYRAAILYLQVANDDDLLCEANLGIAKLYQQINKSDSAIYYAGKSLSYATKGGFLSRQLDAGEFLKNHYKQIKNIDSAFSYVTLVETLNDSINSKSKIRELQIISSNEQVRQLEIEENKKTAARERFQQLQLLFIGIFIPGFFLFTLLLSRIKINVRVIRVLGILSLLILFEYLTLFLHPYVRELTHHIPVYEMLIFVSIAAILIPAHHRLEKWLIEILIRNRTPKPENGKIKIKTSRLKIKRKSG
jgi:tetratricopeptide (TPR) repeat protein